VVVFFTTCKNDEESTDFTGGEIQRINVIKDKYLSIQKNFPGGYFVKAPTISPYSAGEVKNEVLQSGIDAINLRRYIAGLPDDVVLSAEYVDWNQHGAVLLTAVNQLTHSPSKPPDMSDEFYQKAQKGASSSNIATANLPSETISMYMHDSDPGNIERVGHRRWILHPPMKKTGFGVGANRYGLMYAFDRSRGEVDYEYVAWPSPGVFPIELATNNLAWNISVNAQKYGNPDMNKIKVTLKHINSGKSWTFSNSMSGSTERNSAYFNIDLAGYGINNSIIFRPEIDNFAGYKEGDVFHVVVSGLEKDLSYKVKMFSIQK
jgi:hypothetical protein